MRLLRHRTSSTRTTSTASSGRFRPRPALLALALVITSWTATATVTAPNAAAAEPTPLHQTMSGCGAAAPLRTIQANPSNYRSFIAGLLPGDRLLLGAGTYPDGLIISSLNGQPDKCIVIEGPATGSPALFTGSASWNIISLRNSSYLALRNLTLDAQGQESDGIKAEYGTVSVHHVLIEGVSFKNFTSTLASAICTKVPAWNWVIRNNTITAAYTGMNFGLSDDGSGETTNLLIENNLVSNTSSHGIVFYQQAGRNTSIGMPSTGTTIIRNNVLSKETGSLSGASSAPNLRVGPWPESGPGSSDIYQIYGNLFYQNPYDALFQAEGNVAFHDNLLVNRTEFGVNIQPNLSAPRRIDIFNNTIVSGTTGIRITGADPAYSQRVVGNAVFAATPLSGGEQSNNLTGSYSAASTYLNNPMAALGSGLDLYPKTGQLQGAAIDYTAFTGLTDYDRDFNSRSRIATYRGAYSGDGVNPGWTPALTIKPEAATPPPPPPPPPPPGTDVSGCGAVTPLRTIQANPSNYRSLVAGLLPGDRLLLGAGTYTQGLILSSLNGQPEKCIIIEGPASGSPAVFTGSTSWNIISLRNSSYLALRNLALDAQGKACDGIRAENATVSVHHVLIEGVSFKNFTGTAAAAINTKVPAWNWVVRNNTITGAYAGMNFGDSSGSQETANFLIENNLVSNTRSYNIVIFRQLSRNTSIGMPASGTTIIRNNVLSKETGSLSGTSSAPNLRLGNWPLSGAGSSDIYQIYGNLFYQNPYDALFQAEGNISLHEHLLFNRTEYGVNIQPNYSVPRRIDIFNNTIVSGTTGIRVTGADPAYQQRVVGNAVFAATPLSGGQQSDNVTGSYSAASTYLNNPTAALGSGLDLHPKTGQLQGTAIDYTGFTGLTDRDRDFNYRSRVTTFRGAYSSDGVNPGWTPALTIKPQPVLAPGNVLQNGVAVPGLSGATGSQRFWTMIVPAGASNLTFQTSGGTGDADLYMRFDTAPTTTAYDCAPLTADNDQSCTFPAPAPGTWHVLVDGYDAYWAMTLMGSYQTSPACNSVSDAEPNDSASAAQLISGPCTHISGTFLNDAATQVNDYFRLSVPAGRTLTVQLYGLTADYDLQVYDAAGTQVAQSSTSDATTEQASWINTSASAVEVNIRVQRYASTQATYQLGVSY